MIIRENYKKIILLETLLLIVFIFIFSISCSVQYNTYKDIINTKINEIIINIKEKYPETDETKILDDLRNSNSNREKDNFLKEYGYNGDKNYIDEIDNNNKTFMIIDIIIIATLVVIEIVIFMIYQIKQNKRINGINKYLNELNNKNYTLKIEENGEDEISKLRNELYKTTVLLKETAENSEKEKVRLSNSLADISHQLKTPLTSIRIMLDNIYENPNMDEKTRQEFVQDMSRQVEWISTLVISLLKLAKFDAGQIEMNDKEFTVNNLINDIVSNLSILLDIKNIKIITNIDENVKVKLDYNWQKEAVTNIVKNAIEHSKDNSKIFIDVENSSLFLKIKIRDEGDGISKEDKKHIFERFYKAKNSSENSIGIGLSLSKTIIEKDNGYIEVESEEGNGTTFKIKYIK